MSRSRLALAAAIVVSVPSLVLACSVPVFRYALERWPADPYQALVFHRGPLSDEHQALIDRLQPAEGATPVNVQVTAVDLDGAEIEPELREAWDAEAANGEPALPRLVLRYPTQPRTAWSADFNADSVNQLVDSPVRREVAKRILLGNTGVWVFLETGNAARDDAAMNLLQERLAHEEATLELPEIDEQDVKDGLVTIDPAALQVRFSVIRLSRTDPAEQAFVSMLVGSEEDLKEFNDPIAFPVFGRGRVLYALIGDGINADTIGTACAELIGPCTCQIKEQNPGTDVVMSVDWDKEVVQQTKDKPLPALSGLGGFTDVQPQESDAPADDAAADDVQAREQKIAELEEKIGEIEEQLGPIELTRIESVGAASDLPALGSVSRRGVVWTTVAVLGVLVAVVALAGLVLTRKKSS